MIDRLQRALLATGRAIVLALVLSLAVFALMEILPGDAAQAKLGRFATPETLDATRAAMGLDRPAAVRYADWLGGLVRLDLGTSLTTGRPVADAVGERALNTAVLAGVVAAVLVPVSVVLGWIAGWFSGRTPDGLVNMATLGFVALPEFVTGVALILVASVTFDLLPALSLLRPGERPWDRPGLLVLPALTALLVSLASATRTIRAQVRTVARADFVTWARLTGVPERTIAVRHVLRNSLAPSAHVIAQNLSWLIGGLAIVETVFAYPGIGKALVDAVAARDLPTVQSLALLIGLSAVALNRAADIVVRRLSPWTALATT